MTKKELRVKYKALRKSLPKEMRRSYDSLLCAQIIQVLEKRNHVGIFLPIDKHQEIDLRPLLQNTEIHWYAPVTDIDANEMKFCMINQTTSLNENKWGILEPEVHRYVEPEKLDALIIPSLIFDQKGFRVGYGKGFYDLYIKKCRLNCLKIGVNYFEPIDEIYDIEHFDEALNICITPEKKYLCNFIKKKTKK